LSAPQPPDLPGPVFDLAVQLAAVPGVVAVAQRPGEAWSLGVYYRGSRHVLDPAGVRGLGYEGHVSELGEWGPIAHGGAWLTVGDERTPVDLHFRDLEVVQGWLDDARDGEYEVLGQSGWVAGAPTYVPAGELSVSRPILGTLPSPSFPNALAAAAPGRWRERAAVALLLAERHAADRDTATCAGSLASAVLCVAHARLAEERAWALDERGLAKRAGLHEVQRLLASPGATSTKLAATVAEVAVALGVEPLRPR